MNAIKINNVTKIYKLYHNKKDRVKEALSMSKKKRHKDFYALENVSFDIKIGETVGIIGKNGSGKSTLLKIITGVLSPTSGTVEVSGKISALLELGAGFNTEYTGIENIYLNGTIMGYKKEEIDLKIDAILNFADIGDYIYQPVKTYSSGMFVRLAFAVAINVEPEILIVDEALSVGDIFFQAKCYRKFEEFKSKGKTIIFVSHDMSSIVKYCDRVIVLDNGVNIEEGLPAKMVDVYKKVLVNLYSNKEDVDLPKIKNNVEDTNWKKSLAINPNCNEYGNRKASIVDFGVFDDANLLTNVLIKNKEFQFKLKIKFDTQVKEPIYAFTIKDLKGTDLTGTNTMLEYVNTGVNKANDVVEVAFKQKITLQGGNYLVSFGCTGYEENEFVVYHRLYDVVNITVIADKNCVGYFDLNSKVQVNQLFQGK